MAAVLRPSTPPLWGSIQFQDGKRTPLFGFGQISPAPLSPFVGNLFKRETDKLDFMVYVAYFQGGNAPLPESIHSFIHLFLEFLSVLLFLLPAQEADAAGFLMS